MVRLWLNVLRIVCLVVIKNVGNDWGILFLEIWSVKGVYV